MKICGSLVARFTALASSDIRSHQKHSAHINYLSFENHSVGFLDHFRRDNI